MLKKLTTLAAAIALVCAFSANASAATILDGALGTVRSGEPFGDPDVVDYVNFILGMPSPSTDTVDGYTYTRTSLADGGSGSVSSVTGFGSTTSVGAGFEYLLAKYDGPNGGAVLYYLGGASFILQPTSAGVWVNAAGNGFGLSGWKAFGGTTTVPDGGSTAVLLGSVLVGFGILRRRFSNR